MAGIGGHDLATNKGNPFSALLDADDWVRLQRALGPLHFRILLLRLEGVMWDAITREVAQRNTDRLRKNFAEAIKGVCDTLSKERADDQQ